MLLGVVINPPYVRAKQYTSKEKADARHEDVIALFYQKQLEGITES